MTKLYQSVKRQSIAPKAFTEYRQDIARYNLATLRQVGWVGLIGGLALVTVSLPPFRLLSLVWGYAAIAAAFALVVVLAYTLLPRRKGLVLPVYYGFLALLLGIGIVMGTYLGRDTNATTFVMLVITLPLFVIDRPYRLHILTGVMSALFCVADAQVKSGGLLQMDLANCIVFYLLSVVISRQAIHAKMSDIIIKHELKRQRDMDMLTKLSNRGAFERVVAQYIHDSNKNAIMLLLDVDRFKAVNDELGHAAGDAVLQLVGEYLREAFSGGDIVSRLGGDEFVAFLPDVSDLEMVKSRVEQLIVRISGIRVAENQRCRVGASVGIAQYPEDGGSFENLYLQADKALYQAKRKGRGTFAVYDASMEEQAGAEAEK